MSFFLECGGLAAAFDRLTSKEAPMLCNDLKSGSKTPALQKNQASAQVAAGEHSSRKTKN
jgi:hypothetical protein